MNHDNLVREADCQASTCPGNKRRPGSLQPLSHRKETGHSISSKNAHLRIKVEDVLILGIQCVGTDSGVMDLWHKRCNLVQIVGEACVGGNILRQCFQRLFVAVCWLDGRELNSVDGIHLGEWDGKPVLDAQL